VGSAAAAMAEMVDFDDSEVVGSATLRRDAIGTPCPATNTDVSTSAAAPPPGPGGSGGGGGASLRSSEARPSTHCTTHS